MRDGGDGANDTLDAEEEGQGDQRKMRLDASKPRRLPRETCRGMHQSSISRCRHPLQRMEQATQLARRVPLNYFGARRGMMSIQAVCPLCGTSNDEIVYDLTTAVSPDDVPGFVVRCRSCPMWFKLLTDPNGIPTAYPGEYGEGAIAEAYLLSDAARALFREVLANVKFTSAGAKPRLLDIGAAQGALLEEAVRTGFAAEGVDHCESNVRDACAKGLTVHHAAAEDLEYPAVFDVITMMDIIEHVQDPLRLLTTAHRALKPGGELVVYTPNHRAAVVVLSKLLHAVGIRYPTREIFGRNHVCFFDDRSLPWALQKAGFEVRLRRLMPYDPSRPGQYISPLNLAVVTLAEWLGKPFDRVFRILVYAQKANARS